VFTQWHFWVQPRTNAVQRIFGDFAGLGVVATAAAALILTLFKSPNRWVLALVIIAALSVVYMTLRPPVAT
jgi:hypothetical protein